MGIAQAIVHNPKFVVLDEPTNGLDPNQIVEVRHLIKEIAEERSVLLSTHILSEVQATCEEIKMIEQGQLVFSGTLDQFDNYIQPNTIMVTLANPPAEGSLVWEGVSNVERVTVTGSVCVMTEPGNGETGGGAERESGLGIGRVGGGEELHGRGVC